MRAKIKNFKLDKKNKRIGIIVVSVLLLGLIYLININSVPPTENNAEPAAAIAVDSGKSLINDITFAPQRALDYALFKLAGDQVIFYRIVSAIVAFAAVGAFFFLIKHWISLRVAALSTALFASSSWVIHDARWAQPEAILLLALPLILLAGTMQKIKEYDPLLPLTSLAAALMLYIPGFWAFFLAGVIVVFRDLLDAWQELSTKARALWAGVFVLALLPLVAGLTRPGILKSWLGVPENVSLPAFLENIRQLPGQLFINGIPESILWLPGTPILDAVTAVFFALGAAYTIRDSRYPIRRYVLIAAGALAVILIGFIGPVYISLLLPLVYVFVAFGVAFLLEQWFHIFPKNPMARSFGLIIVSTLVFLTCSYHIFRYHHAWPRSPETSEVFKG